jgi:hypothetical protein
MNSIVKALIYSNCWVAFCFSFLSYGFSRHFHIPYAEKYAVFLFFSAISAYQFHRYFTNKQQQTNRQNWVNKNKFWNNLVSIIGLLGLFRTVTFINWGNTSKVIIASNLLIVIFYVLPFPLLNKPFRSLRYLKTILISASWTSMLSLPFINEAREMPLFLIGFIVLQTIGQLIYFDCRDYQHDEKTLQTIPQLIGIKQSKIVAVVCFILSLFLFQIGEKFSFLLLFIFLSNVSGLIIKEEEQDSAFAAFIWDLPFFIIGCSFLWY